ncbi:G protein-regulated inducer of neurite outgrowth 1 isoform 1-T3 [Theristicus caerulescens]
MECCTLGQGVSFAGGPPRQPGVPPPAWPQGGVPGHETGATSLCLVAFCSTWLLPAGGGCSRGISCLRHRSGDGSGWARAGRCWLPRALAWLPSRAAASLPALERRWCITVPPLCLPRAWPRSGQPAAVHTWVPVAAQGGGVRPSPPQPCPLCPAAVPWVPRSWEDVATQGTGTDLKWERLGPTTPAVESRSSPWLEALGKIPTAPSPPLPRDLPGGDRQSPGHILTSAGGGDEACPATGPIQPPQCRRGPVRWGCGRVSLRGCLQPRWLLSPTAAGDAPAARCCHFLQLGFYRAGGRGAFIEPCLHFWSFLRDTYFQLCTSCLEPPPPRWPAGP